MTHREQVYGPFTGGDPRQFEPDRECCTPAEIAAWEQACREWAAGEGIDRGPGCSVMGDFSVWDGTGFGVGTTTIEDCDCDEPPGECSHGVPLARGHECGECKAFFDKIFGHPGMHGKGFA